MKKSYKVGIIAFLISLFTLAGVFMFGMLLMEEEDFHVDREDIKTTLQDGDIIFQTSKSAQSMAIQKATKSRYSHMGIIYKVDGDVYVFEAVQPVKLTPIADWIARGKNEHYVIKRLKDAGTLLDDEALEKMKQIGERYLGKDYDIYFEWSDDKIYCSELVWKIYKEALNVEIGNLELLKNFDLSDKLVRKTLKKRYGDAVPMNEAVISPSQMFDSEMLVTVYSD